VVLVVRCLGRALALAAILGSLSLSGCAQIGMSPSKLTADPASLDRIFRLGTGDRLKVTVFGEEELSGEADVNASGNVSLPLLGEVPAKGRTIEQFTEGLRAKLEEGYLKNPKIGVQVIHYRPIYVQGEVRNGGEFPFKLGLKVADAVAMAGGYSYRADTSFINLRREGDADTRAVALQGDIPLLPGDNILIPERFF
jgi:protein involved in polysaccharide export with SLBB domain